MTNPRISIIVRAAGPDRDWKYSGSTSTAFLDCFETLRFALTRMAYEGSGLDIERAIVDRAATSDQILALLAQIPAEFIGDLLLIEARGTGFLSAVGRGGNRVLYALSAGDVRFYLETNDLVTGRIALERTA
jgi:hypothetical protein